MNRTQSDVRRFVICPGSAALHSEIGVVHAAGLARLRSSRCHDGRHIAGEGLGASTNTEGPAVTSWALFVLIYSRECVSRS